MSATSAFLAGSASAFPLAISQGELWDGYFSHHYAGRRAAHAAFFSTGVERRHAAVNPLVEDLSRTGTASRMARYALEATPLAKEAVTGALAGAFVEPQAVGLLAVVSCTGYATPGIDVSLARDLAMRPDLERLLVGHVGCHAALPALRAVHDFVAQRQEPGILLCLELPSLHVQPPTDELDQVIVHALFGDAASAVVLLPGESAADGLEIVDFAARTDTTAADFMTWTITDLGFRMGLSRHVPEAIARHVAPLVDELLARNGLGREDIGAWAIHPGGPRILDVVGERLALGDGDLDASRRVLAERGNCSSASILLVLEELCQRSCAAGSYVVVVTFGPGLTLYAALLRCG